MWKKLLWMTLMSAALVGEVYLITGGSRGVEKRQRLNVARK